jgi:predicted enzyme related to lactoylglutathione lyase
VANPIVHAEIIGRDPELLQAFYRELFGWESDTSAPISPAVSEAGRYGFVDLDGDSVPVGIGGGREHQPHIVFYVGVPEVEEALARAQELGATRVLGPERVQGRGLVIGHLLDPEGNLVGVAGPA